MLEFTKLSFDRSIKTCLLLQLSSSCPSLPVKQGREVSIFQIKIFAKMCLCDLSPSKPTFWSRCLESQYRSCITLFWGTKFLSKLRASDLRPFTDRFCETTAFLLFFLSSRNCIFKVLVLDHGTSQRIWKQRDSDLIDSYCPNQIYICTLKYRHRFCV